jgi:RNA polymerase sigma-70 factor (ECF subfamily)
MATDDAELLKRWQRGDAAAFEMLVHRWQQPVGRILARLVGKHQVVSDLAQEVFLRVHQAAPRYREKGFFATWLYRIALSVARDAQRRRRRLDALISEPPDPSKSADAVCAQKESAQAVIAALEELPGPLREVLVLRHYEQMNFEDMSRLMGTPASTLKSRFAAALNRLRSRLQQLGFSAEEIES